MLLFPFLPPKFCKNFMQKSAKLIVPRSAIHRAILAVVLVMHRHRALVRPYFYFSPSYRWNFYHPSYGNIKRHKMIKVMNPEKNFFRNGRTYSLSIIQDHGRPVALSNSAARAGTGFCMYICVHRCVLLLKIARYIALVRCLCQNGIM
jgi:hypothetical protein